MVGTQSIAVAATSLRRSLPAALAALAICCWAVGVTLYLVIAVMVAVALFDRPVRPAELTPLYWVFMGRLRSACWPGPSYWPCRLIRCAPRCGGPFPGCR